MMIDFHVHTFPEQIAAAALAKLQGNCHTATFSDGTVPGLVQSMAEAGISHSVVLPVATNPLKVSHINDASIRANGQQGLIHFGGIHPDMADWHAELGRLAQAGIKGIKLHPIYQNADIDDVRFLRILDRAGALGLIVVMHAGEDVGFPGMVRCHPRMIANALKQVGPVTLVAAHMGGWRNWDMVADCLSDTSVYLDTAFTLGSLTPLDDGYYTPEHLPMLHAADFCRLVRAFGSRRILFATDSPWASQADSVAQIRALPLTDSEKEDIFSGNARRLLGLPCHSPLTAAP